MRRARLLLLLMSLTLAASACSGGSSAHGDYLSQLPGVLNFCGSSSQNDNVNSPGDFADRLQALRPPADLRRVHNDLVAAARRAASASTPIPQSSTSGPDPTVVSAFQDLTDAYAAWRAKVRDDFHADLFYVEGVAMEPAFRNGETLVLKSSDKPLTRWQTVVFKFPLDTSRDFFKRVVGLPGETVEIKDGGAIYINGAPVDGDVYARDSANYTYGPKTVPAGTYFVLGDNRRNSYDSHAWGASCSADKQCDFLPAANILGELPADAHGCRAGNN